MKTKCLCDKCNKEFKIKVRQLQYIPDGKIVIEGFECPHCHHEYITTVTDNTLRQGIFEARQLKDEITEVNRKKDKEFQAYMEDVGKVPTRLCLKYKQQLEELQFKYRAICRTNQIRAKQLNAIYNPD